MQESEKDLPHYKTYIQQNWSIYKSYTASNLKSLIIPYCQPLTDEENNKFNKWFQNKKTNESKCTKRKQANSTKSSKNLPVTPNDMIYYETKSVSDSELTLEEKKQDKNLELFLKDESQLIQNLLQLTSFKEKLAFLRQQLQENLMVLLEFMQNRRESPSGFLELVLVLCKELDQKDQHSQVLLFVRICALHQREYLEVTKDLIKNALVELAFKAKDEQAAYGLLKLSYINHISFKVFPMDALVQFQNKYEISFKRFLLYLEGTVDNKVLKCLPHTCFIFTLPFYNVLNDSGARLQKNINPHYQIQFVELLAYSFECDQQNFLEFIDIFIQGCIQIYGRSIQLLPLLERIIQREKQKDIKFFGSLKNHIKLFMHLFDQIKEERIVKLDNENIEELLLVNEEKYIKQSKLPRIINSSDEAETILTNYWQYMKDLNAGNLSSSFSPTVPISHSLNKVMSLFGIKCFNSAQIVSFQVMKENFQSHRIFQQFTTGSGKTTLTLIWMLYVLMEYKIQSISNYTSLELCHYDYQRLFKQAESLGLSISLITKEEHLSQWKNCQIIFITTPLLKILVKDLSNHSELIQKQLVLDEFDSTIFDELTGSNDILNFMKFRHLVGFTGSPLEEVHKNIVKQNLGGLLVEYPSLSQVGDKQNICHQTKVFEKRPQQVKAIVDLCIKQTPHTPTIIILDESVYTTLTRMATTNGLLVQNLAKTDPAGIQSFLSTTFTNPQNGLYYVAILSREQGRGLDVPTTSSIEKAGGIYVVIASIPSTFRQLQQFKGRTARMGGKGQHSIMLLAKTQSQGETFLQQSLTTASSRELEQLARDYLNVTTPQLINVFLGDKQQQEEDNVEGESNQDMDPRTQDENILVSPQIIQGHNSNHQGNSNQEAKENCYENHDGAQSKEKDEKKENSYIIDKIIDEPSLLNQTLIGDQFGILNDTEDDNQLNVGKVEAGPFQKSQTNKRSKKIKTKKPLIKGKPTNKIQLKMSEAQVDKQVGPKAAPTQEEPQTLDSAIQPNQSSLADLDKEGKKTAIRSKVPIEKDQDAPTPKRGNYKIIVQIGEMAVKQQKELKQRDDGLTCNLGKRKKVEPSKMEGKQEKMNKKQKLQ